MIQITIPQFLAVITLFYVIALILFSLRIWTRLRSRTFALDDYLISFSFLCATGSYICCMLSIHYGLGTHLWTFNFTVSPVKLEDLIKIIFAQNQCYIFAITALKVGIAWQIMRIKGENMLWRVGLWLIIVSNVIVFLAAIFIDYLEYKPFKAEFQLTAGPENLRISIAGIKEFGKFVEIWYPISDIVLALIPVLFIYNLSRPLRERLVLCVLLALGLTCFAVTIPRLVDWFGKGLNLDITYNGISAIYWSELELLIGLWAACIPPLRSLFETWLIKMGFDITSGSSGSDPANANFEWSRKMNKKHAKGQVDVEKDAGSLEGGSQEAVAKPNPVVSSEPHRDTWVADNSS